MHGSSEACRAEIVLSSLQQDGFKFLAQHPAHQGDVFVEQLFLKIDCMCADESFPSGTPGMKDGGDQIGE